MDFIVADPTAKTFTLTRPGPGEKGTLSLTLRVKGRYLPVPDVTASVFAAQLSAAVESGALIVPARNEDAPAEPTVEITEAEITEAPRRSRRRPAEE